MRSSQKEINERRDQIFNTLLKEGEIQVKDLAQELNVSELTIRRDLLFFEEKKYIERFYGGARLLNPHALHSPSQTLNRIKNRIAKKAADLIDSGDIIFINTSSTALLTLRYLGNKEATVITNNAKAVFVKTSPKVTIILSGGELRNPKETMVGDFALQTLRMVNVSKAILGCSGLSYEQGITTSVHSEVSINQLMLENCSGPRIIVADQSKLGHSASFVSGSIHDVDVLVTNHASEAEALEKFKEQTEMKILLV